MIADKNSAGTLLRYRTGLKRRSHSFIGTTWRHGDILRRALRLRYIAGLHGFSAEHHSGRRRRRRGRVKRWMNDAAEATPTSLVIGQPRRQQGGTVEPRGPQAPRLLLLLMRRQWQRRRPRRWSPGHWIKSVYKWFAVTVSSPRDADS